MFKSGWQDVRAQFDGFERLFARFLQETGPSVKWEDISVLPNEAVGFLIL